MVCKVYGHSWSNKQIKVDIPTRKTCENPMNLHVRCAQFNLFNFFPTLEIGITKKAHTFFITHVKCLG